MSIRLLVWNYYTKYFLKLLLYIRKDKVIHRSQQGIKFLPLPIIICSKFRSVSKFESGFQQVSAATILPLLLVLISDTEMHWLELFTAQTKSNIWLFLSFPAIEISFLLFSVLGNPQNEGVVLKKLTEQMEWLWLTILCLQKDYLYFWEKKNKKQHTNLSGCYLMPNIQFLMEK